jgi:hypothetical protein
MLGLTLQAHAQVVALLGQALSLAYQAQQRLTCFFFIFFFSFSVFFLNNALFVCIFSNKYSVYVLIRL